MPSCALGFKRDQTKIQKGPVTLARGQYPKLREFLGAVVAYMSVSINYKDFMEKPDRFRPRLCDQYELPLEYQADEDTGIGL